MELSINPDPAEIMHIDLNSAFAMTEQQANPLLRGKPVGITNRLNDYAICIAASYEAKALGINLGTRNREGRLKAPDFVMLESDPAKYQYVHRQMKAIFESYSPSAHMKSVDEGVIDFRGMQSLLKGRSLQDIGAEIKQRVREEIGDYMKVNVGIGQNRWMAKLAAGFMKPDGLYQIDRDNLEVVYSMLHLTDFPYIAGRMKLRLNTAGIYTPLEFFQASEQTLTKQVFRSINGHHWYLKLRGYETEVSFGIKTVSRSYVLEHRTSDPEELALLFHKAAEKVSRRLRKNNLAARGFMLGLNYSRQSSLDTPEGRRYWQDRQMYRVAVRRSDQLYQRALELYRRSPKGEVSGLVMTAYALESFQENQPQLYETYDSRLERVEDAINTINDRYGELVLTTAATLKSKNPMKDKIPFGTVRYFG